MRVVMVILEYHPIVGGAQRQLANVAPRLAARGVEVHVITRAVIGHPARERHEGVEIHRLPAPGPKAFASIVFTTLALARVIALRPALVHGYSLFSPATVAFLARRLLGVPAVIKILRGGQGGEVARMAHKTVGPARLRALIREIDAFLVISSEIDEELAALGIAADKRVPMPNGVDDTRYSPLGAEARAALRERLELVAGRPTVLFCGRLVPEKRVVELVMAWPEVMASHPDAQLVIAGDGPEAKRIDALGVAGVRRLGELDEVVEWLRAVDGFVLPSETEGLSNAMLEAAACALPIVATHVGAASDVIEDRRSGFLVPARDQAALVRALVRLLDAPDRGAMGRRGREIVQSRYALDAVAESLVSLYERLTGSAVGRSNAQGQPPLPGIDGEDRASSVTPDVAARSRMEIEEGSKP